MSKPTPGPWRAGKIPTSPFADPPEVMVIQGACGEWVCKMLHPSDDPKAAANAALIAKAYLLPEVERVLERLCAAKNPLDWSPSVELVEAFAECRALLAALKEKP